MNVGIISSASTTSSPNSQNNTVTLRDGEVILYKRGKSGRWQARYKLPSGEWVRISTKRNNLRDAQDYAGEQYVELRRKLTH